MITNDDADKINDILRRSEEIRSKRNRLVHDTGVENRGLENDVNDMYNNDIQIKRRCFLMKIIGRLFGEMDQYTSVHTAGGAYIAVNVQSAYVESYNGKSVDKCDKFFVVVYAGNFRYDIQYSKGNYLSSEEANQIIKELVKKDYLDLDEYNLYFTSVHRFTSVEVSNYDDEYEGELVPLKVTIVADETKNN